MNPNGETTVEEKIEAIYVNLADIVSLELEETDIQLKKSLVLKNGCTVTYTIDKVNSSYNLNAENASTQYSDVREGFVEVKISSQKK
jgi:hypothetical protein